jgi:hypothetical protein
MSVVFFILTNRLGADIRNPSAEAIQGAVREVMLPKHRTDSEHSEVILRYAFDAGPMYVITYDASKKLTFEQWDDHDFESEIVPTGHLTDITPSDAAKIMMQLAEGDIKAIKQYSWTSH